MSHIFGVDSNKVIAGVVALFIGIVSFDGERALNKLDAIDQATAANATQIGINMSSIKLLQADDADKETRLRVLERESYKKPTVETIPTEWLPPPQDRPENLMLKLKAP